MGQPNLAIHFAGKTDTGLVREENQDFVFWDAAMGLYMVLDGMGGHQGGATASRMACETIVASIRNAQAMQATNRADSESALSTSAQQLINAYQEATARVHHEANRDRSLRGMGTTVVGVMIPRPDLAIIAHVGDSRAYLMREGRLQPMTADHTVVEELVALGRLTPAEAKDHPHSSVLSRNIGGMPATTVEHSAIELVHGDKLLLCSDGLNGYASHGAMEKILSGTSSVDKACHDLVELAKRGGGGDNVTALVIEVVDPTIPAVEESGAMTWWQRRSLFLDTCQHMGMGNSPIHLADPEETVAAMELAGRFFEAVFYDLQNSSGVHVWTFADQLVRPWFQRQTELTLSYDPFLPIQEFFDTLRAGAMAIVSELSAIDEDFAVCLEISTLRSLVIAEMVIGGVLGEHIENANQMIAPIVTTPLPKDTFLETTMPVPKGFSATTPAVKDCLEEAVGIVQGELPTSDPLIRDILTATHNAAESFCGDVDMTSAAQDLYGNHLLAEQQIGTILGAFDTCRYAHLAAVEVQRSIAPQTRTLAYQILARSYMNLFHGFTLVTVAAGKPTTERLQALCSENNQMRERIANNEQVLRGQGLSTPVCQTQEATE